MPTITEDQIIEAIRPVQDPDLGRSLVELNMVKGVEIDGGRVKINVELTTPACPLRGKIEDDVRAAAVTVPGVDDVAIAFTARVRSSGMGHARQDATERRQECDRDCLR